MYAPHNERLFKFLGYRIPEWETVSQPLLPGVANDSIGSAVASPTPPQVLAVVNVSGAGSSAVSGLRVDEVKDNICAHVSEIRKETEVLINGSAESDRVDKEATTI
jgi:hypothetical protein